MITQAGFFTIFRPGHFAFFVCIYMRLVELTFIFAIYLGHGCFLLDRIFQETIMTRIEIPVKVWLTEHLRRKKIKNILAYPNS